MSRPDVESIFFLAYTMSGEEFEMEGEVWPASEEDNLLARKFVGVCEALLEDGRIRSHPVSKREGGLEGILGGMMEVSLSLHLITCIFDSTLEFKDLVREVVLEIDMC